MKTEADVAAHLGVPACIIYAQSFSTISSVIPSFSKRGDIIVADKAVNFSTRKGIQISRSTVRWYEHNDMEDLERVQSFGAWWTVPTEECLVEIRMRVEA